MIKSFFKDRGFGFYLTLTSCVLALVGNILFFVLDSGDRTFSLVTFISVFLGVAFGVAALFLNFSFLPLLSACGMGVGFSYHVYTALPTYSDIWNKVNFIGGNATMATVFMIIFGLTFILSCIACFNED